MNSKKEEICTKFAFINCEIFVSVNCPNVFFFIREYETYCIHKPIGNERKDLLNLKLGTPPK